MSSSDKRRPRAPTINIDTSAASESQSDQPPPEQIPLDSPKDLLAVPGGQGGSRRSFDSSESRTAVGSNGDSSEASDILQDPTPLRPDPGTEDDFQVENNKFAFAPGHLAKLLNPKSLAALYALGGPIGLEKGLRSNLKAGLSVDEQALDGNVSFEEATHQSTRDAAMERSASEAPNLLHPPTQSSVPAQASPDSFADRKRVFSDNRLPEKKAKTIWQIAWTAYKDKVLILLSIAAAVSLAIGVYQSIEGGGSPEWVEGVAIIVAIAVVVVVGALNDWQKERQFVKLNKKKQDRSVQVVRSGSTKQISVYDVLVGDLLLLEQGDIVPVDGIYLEGHNLSCDESSATGESDLMKKSPAADAFKALDERRSVRKMDPFILSGAKVSEGVGRCIVTGTGVNSSYGKLVMSLQDDVESTPLQSKLNKLADNIGKLAIASAVTYFIVVFIEFLVRITRGREQEWTSTRKGQDFLQIFVVSVSIVVVAIPEGLPLAVTLALAFATKRLLKANNLVRHLRSCETMGNATTVCSDKTGTLTQNKMSVVAGTVGTSSRFGDHQAVEDDDQPTTKDIDQGSKDVTPQECVGTLDHNVKDVLEQSIAINSTAFEGEVDGKPGFVGSKTETALLDFAQTYLAMGSVAVERANVEITQFIPFDSNRKCMAVVLKLPSGGYRLLVKGAAEILLGQCSQIIESSTKSPTKPTSLETPASQESSSTGRSESGSVPTIPLGGQAEALKHIISSYASRSLRTIALVYREFGSWPPPGCRRGEDGQVVFEDVFRELTFLSVVGIQDPLRPGVAESVADCKRAGVFVRMVTGDNIQTAKAIATECGILTPGGEVMEGPEFRRLSKPQIDDKLPKLQVLARSSPEDKRKLVKRLKELGETVAVTGDGTNDAPALKTADVGFSMGIGGTEVAKEASAIILMDDNFSSIVGALMWGRAVNDAVKKFLQFQITVNITAVLVTFVSGVSSGSEGSVLTAVQLLWVNLIMDTLAALALATDPPSRSILDRPPDRKNASLFSVTMWKMIFGQAIYQMTVVFVLFFRGHEILGYTSDEELAQLRTLIFNMFVWMQIFNAWNNRRLDNKFNIFEGVLRNWLFIVIMCVMIGGQVMIAFVGGAAFKVVRLNGAQWGYSLVLGALSLLVGIVVRLIPDEFIRAIAGMLPAGMVRYLSRSETTTDEEAQKFEWNPAINEVREELTFLKTFKGGRLNNLKFKIQHARESGLFPSRPSTNRSRSSTNNTLPAAAVAAGVVAGSIGGWSPIERNADGAGDKKFP
ncbi:MAG: hypothetical protein M1831_006915 [Alyxoria varia]|nr:MAG: hypothetical protein M1831_006915 [Alyxoria varia]